MIKIDGVDIPRIEYIDPVDGKVSILRVMKDGVQIWPVDSGVPNIPTGIQLSEYEIEEPSIQWDYFITYTVTTNTEVRAYLKDDVILPFTGGDETQFGLKVNGSPVVFTNFGIHYAPGASYVTLRNPTDFLLTDVIEFSYTAGADPIEGENTGTFAPDLVDQLVENTVEAPTYTYLLDDYPGAHIAYSLRKLHPDAIYACRVRRSDGSETDVDLYDDPDKIIDGDSLVSAGGTLSVWGGVSKLSIPTFYNQVLGNLDVGNIYAGSQPIIGDAGTVYDRILMTDKQLSNDAIAINQPVTYFIVKSMDTTADANNRPMDGFTGRHLIAGSASQWRLFAGAWLISGIPVDTNQNLMYSLFNEASSELAINNNTASVGNVGTQDLIGLKIGSTGITFYGSLYEFIAYDSDQSANRVGISDNINAKYNLWVPTAQVDAQLIQADSDNISNTVIEINGVRSSASDTAVANLISRGNTVITA